MSFTPKQRAFITAYLGDGESRGNATASAREAGYAHPEGSAADLMLKGSKVRAEIERILEERLPSEGELFAELAWLAMAREGVNDATKRGAITDLLKLRGRILDRVAVTVDTDRLDNLLGLTSDPSDDSEGDE